MVGTFIAFLPLIAAGFIAIIMYLTTTSRGRSRDSQGKFLGLLVVILGVGLVLVISGYNGLLARPLQAVGLYPSAESQRTIIDGISLAPGAGQDSPDKFYGIMFDAGSTGSRIHVFEFINQGPGIPPKYLREEFQQVKPGLSSYAADAVKGADSLTSLLEIANKVIPESKRSQTPVALKATAGLRALPEEQSKALLNEVNMLFDKYAFQKAGDSVTIMEGNDEGKFSWFTVNFLAEVLGDSDKMVGVMDLGGGSTQITFVPSAKATIDSAPSGFLVPTDIFGKTHSLYTHSYPLGLMAGRYKILGGKGEDSETAFSTVCFPPNANDKLKFNNKEFDVSSATPSSSRYEECYALAKAVVDEQNIHKVEEVKTRPFWTISYYYDRAVDAKLISEADGGQIQVQDYINSAIKECGSPSGEGAWQCMDLCFISSLLQDGFGFNKDTTVTLRKQINSNEISWALGAMFDWFGRHKESVPAQGAAAAAGAR